MDKYLIDVAPVELNQAGQRICFDALVVEPLEQRFELVELRPGLGVSLAF